MAGGELYDALQVAADCSADEIRRAYHRLALQLHPDKQLGTADDDAAASDERFQRVQQAYEVLRDPTLRAAYDRQLAHDAVLRQRDYEDVRIAEEVPVAEMTRRESEDEVLFSHQCRCGDVYEISEDELREGVDIVPCNGCSLNIRVLGGAP